MVFRKLNQFPLVGGRFRFECVHILLHFVCMTLLMVFQSSFVSHDKKCCAYYLREMQNKNRILLAEYSQTVFFLNKEINQLMEFFMLIFREFFYG